MYCSISHLGIQLRFLSPSLLEIHFPLFFGDQCLFAPAAQPFIISLPSSFFLCHGKISDCSLIGPSATSHTFSLRHQGSKFLWKLRSWLKTAKLCLRKLQWGHCCCSYDTMCAWTELRMLRVWCAVSAVLLPTRFRSFICCNICLTDAQTDFPLHMRQQKHFSCSYFHLFPHQTTMNSDWPNCLSLLGHAMCISGCSECSQPLAELVEFSHVCTVLNDDGNLWGHDQFSFFSLAKVLSKKLSLQT